MTLYDFLEKVCAQVKYRSIHSEIRNELSEHVLEIEENENLTTEQAIAVMGDPTEIGKSINANYRMPFNSRCGLYIWSAIITAVICLAYPYLKALSQTNIGFGIMLIIIAAYSVLCGFAIHRSNTRISLRDISNVAIGSIAGTILTLAVVYAFSFLFKQRVYPYSQNVYIPFGINLNALTFLTVLVLWSALVYWCSCKLVIRKKLNDRVVNGALVYDNDFIFGYKFSMGTDMIRGKYSSEMDNLKITERKRNPKD